MSEQTSSHQHLDNQNTEITQEQTKASAENNGNETAGSEESIRELVLLINEALDDLKAIDIVELDIRELSTVADMMIVASGNSQRHVKAIANNVQEKLKEAGFKPIGIEGTDVSEWVLLDFGDVITHIMLPKTRSFYELEKLWSARPSSSNTSSGDTSNGITSADNQE